MQIFANGISLEVEDHGKPSGEPLLLIMGLGMQLVGWHMDFVSTLVQRGFRVIRVVVMSSAVLVAALIPLGNVVPAIVIALISLAYLEEDGLLLSIALLAAVIVLTVMLVAVWEAVLGAKWIISLW